ncbi:MAG: RDD family protein [Acidimicrobiales bacterium]
MANHAPAPGVPLAPFGAPLAGWRQRVGSMVLDTLIVGVPMLLLDVILNAHFGTRHRVVLGGTTEWVRSLQGGGRTALFIAEVCVPLLYFAILNGTRDGQTAGNRAPHIAVRDASTGEAIGFGRGVVRWLTRLVLYAALILPGVLNDLFPLWDRRRQSIADKVAHSVVIRLD